ncbi:MAG: ribokinase [Candidatus Bipolaricaulota bacterium]
MGLIAVLASINMDLVTEVERLPRSGETVQGTSFARYCGGKGANQAVAAARLGGEVLCFGKVGQDLWGDELVKALEGDMVDAQYVEREEDFHSGVACISVSKNGENAIVYVGGANATVDPGYIERVWQWVVGAEVLLIQLEVPLETVGYVLRHLPPDGPRVILDPAPAMDLSSLPLTRVDIITPNRRELVALTNESSLEPAAELLLRRGVGCVVCKLGEEGAYVADKDGVFRMRPFVVQAVDTTGAGDAFNGALGVMLEEGRSLGEAIRWANAAGALAATRKGAHTSLPERKRVEELLASGGHWSADGG